MGRTLAIGDIHGCLTALETLADFARIATDDLVVTLGDYVDRGPDSAGVLDWVIRRLNTGRLVPLLGNHEIMMLDAFKGGSHLEGWLSVGGRAAIDSYRARGLSGKLEDIPEDHRYFLRIECLNYYEVDTHFFVHANAFPDYDLDEQPDFMLFWESWRGARRHKSGKVMICGHTAQRSGWPGIDENSVCIDTRAHGENGWLTCLDIASGQFWQASQLGQTRRGFLDEVLD